MAGKKSKSGNGQSKRSSKFSRLVWVIWMVVGGGGVAGWAAPDLPVLGPLVQRIVRARQGTGAKGTDDAAQSVGEKVQEKLAQLRPSGSDHATTPASPGGAAPAQLTSVQKPQDTILIASFNIQVFGTSKMSKSWVVDVLAQVVRQFDVVAIQEIRSKDDAILPNFVAAVNADGSRFHYVIGPRLGRSVSTEQYAFVYDTNRIEIDTSSIGSMEDPNDALHREPFVSRFRTRVQTPNSAFSFWLVNIHTDPDEVKTEVDVLADVFQVMQGARVDEDDVILLGDLNASERQFGRLGQIPGMTWAVTGKMTNTRGTKMYDNLLFVQNATVEYTGRWGIVDLQSAFGLTLEQALKVSDHLPVWAEFSVWESRSQDRTARLPGSRLR